jgi:hypothetical protein
MFEKDLIRDNSLKPVIQEGVNWGISFESRLPFYRALPLSCIENLTLIINDETIDNNNIRLMLRGESYALDDLSWRMDVWWGFTEDATILVKNTGSPYRGLVELDLAMRVRLPYLIPSDGEERPNYDNSRVVRQFKLA